MIGKYVVSESSSIRCKLLYTNGLVQLSRHLKQLAAEREE